MKAFKLASPPSTSYSVRHVTTAETINKTQTPLQTHRKEKKTFLSPQLSHLLSTPNFPTSSPQKYGQQYLKKFESYIDGQITGIDVIKFKNILLTKKPEQQKDALSFNSLNKVIKYKTKIQIKRQTQSVINQVQQEEQQKQNNQELEQFVEHYYGKIQRRIRKNTKNKTQRFDKQSIYVQETEDKFDKIRNLIDRRQKFTSTEDKQLVKNYKIIENFNQITDEYKNRIQNHDLLNSDHTKAYYQSNDRKKKNNLKTLAIIRPSTHSQYSRTKPQDQDPEQMQLNIKKEFTKASNNYLQELIKNKEQQKFAENQEKLNSNHQKNSLKAKALENIVSRDYDKRLQNFINQVDLLEKYSNTKHIKEDFIQKLANLDQIGEELIKSSQKINSSSCQRFKNHFDSIKQKSYSNTNNNNNFHKRFKSTLENVEIDESGQTGNSMISETEANLGQLYEQSIFLQQRVMQKGEKMNKLMNYFIKLESIKKKIREINQQKLT